MRYRRKLRNLLSKFIWTDTEFRPESHCFKDVAYVQICFAGLARIERMVLASNMPEVTMFLSMKIDNQEQLMQPVPAMLFCEVAFPISLLSTPIRVGEMLKLQLSEPIPKIQIVALVSREVVVCRFRWLRPLARWLYRGWPISRVEYV